MSNPFISYRYDAPYFCFVDLFSFFRLPMNDVATIIRRQRAIPCHVHVIGTIVFQAFK